MRLKDKVAVITGASAGFGMSRGFPEGFAREGANLVLNYFAQPKSSNGSVQKGIRGFEQCQGCVGGRGYI